MNELHKQIRKDAEKALDGMVSDIRTATSAVAGMHQGIDSGWLSRLAIGGRTAALRKKCIAILAAEREKDLLDLYQKKPELKAVGGK